MNKSRGLVIVYTGEGKGKTTAAIGAAMRAAGHDMKTLIIQFIKSGTNKDGTAYGELGALKRVEGVDIRSTGLGLIKRGDDPAPHREKARAAWEMSCREMSSGQWDLLILDELCAAMARGFVDTDEVRRLIASRPPNQHLIITGRGFPDELVDCVDTITHMGEVKHHIKAGVTSQMGVEY